MVFTVSSAPRRNGVVVTDADGTVLSVSKGRPSFDEMAGVQYYSGILVPGFVDVMCGGATDPARLLTRGIRVAGTTVVPPGVAGPAQESAGQPEGGTGQPGDAARQPGDAARQPGDAARQTGDAAMQPGDAAGQPGGVRRFFWKGRYGGDVGFVVYRQMEQFERRFRKGPAEGVLLWGETDKPVLAGYGEQEMLQLMIRLQDSHGYKLPDLLSMATINGAHATGFGAVAGSIEPGRNPGLNIIEGVDPQQMKLLPGSRLRRLC